MRFACAPATLQHWFEGIEHRYGGLGSVLAESGLSGETPARLRDKLRATFEAP
jgi:hypothetical protein